MKRNIYVHMLCVSLFPIALFASNNNIMHYYSSVKSRRFCRLICFRRFTTYVLHNNILYMHTYTLSPHNSYSRGGYCIGLYYRLLSANSEISVYFLRLQLHRSTDNVGENCVFVGAIVETFFAHCGAYCPHLGRDIVAAGY